MRHELVEATSTFASFSHAYTFSNTFFVVLIARRIAKMAADD
jgi:hypothetical protein